MDATRTAEDRIMAPILGRLEREAQALQVVLVRAHDAGRPVPGIDRKLGRLIATMRAAVGETVVRTDGLTRADLKPALDWRTSKARELTKLIKSTDSPPLGVLLTLPAQARGLAADLRRHVSDTLVAELTAERERDAGPGDVLIWEAERDACVRCLRYAGMFRDAQDDFQAGLSFDPNAPKPDPGDRLKGPPLHGECRCELVIIPRHAAASNSDALEREARRSVLKGWALDSESDAARIRAAKALLDSHVVAPKSVIEETRKRLKLDEPFIRNPP